MIQFLLSIVLLFQAALHAEGLPVLWFMIDVQEGTQQGDAHLLQFPGGERILIDTGRSGRPLVEFMKAHRFLRVDDVYITHAHDDHYGGLIPLIKAGIVVGRVHMNPPSRVVCVSDSLCKFAEIEALQKQLESEFHIVVQPVKEGEVVFQAGQIQLKVIAAYDGLNTPVGKTDVNDMSLVMRLANGKTSALFTGDLNRPIGHYLATHKSAALSSTLLKVPHHGASSVAGDEFFDAVFPMMAFVPAPKSLWESDRTKGVRTYLEKQKIPALVSGLVGDITVILYPDRFDVVSGHERYTGAP